VKINGVVADIICFAIIISCAFLPGKRQSVMGSHCVFVHVKRLLFFKKSYLKSTQFRHTVRHVNLTNGTKLLSMNLPPKGQRKLAEL